MSQPFRTKNGTKKKFLFLIMKLETILRMMNGCIHLFGIKILTAMAHKTMLRQLISKWGTMSIDLVQAIDADMAVIHADGTKDYVETDMDNIAAEQPAVSPEPEVEPQGQETMEQTVQPEQSNGVADNFFS